jgi:predicted  nucleic acid-binding Zn-ribbon protein
MRYYELTINIKEKEVDALLEKVISYLPSPPAQQQKQASFLTLEFYTEPEKIKELEKKLKEASLRYIILAKELPKKTPEISKRPTRTITGAKPKVKMELKEIDKKLEEILEEN